MLSAVGAAVPLVAADRGDVREATHAGHIAVVDAGGAPVATLGDAQRLTYLRSSAKPLQALAALETGMADRFGLELEQIAIMCASHSGEPPHVEAVRELLRRAAVPEDALECGAHWPHSEAAASELRTQGSAPLPVHNNCSGKHAGMLAAARVMGAPLETYLDPRHPVQQRIRATIARLAGLPGERLREGTDGCSAPNAALPLEAMARAFAALLAAREAEALRVVAAMTGHPFLVAGTGRFDTALMEATQGRILAKGGAAGVHCSADRRSGQGLAVKLESGDGTWMGAAVVAAMGQLGWLAPHEIAALGAFAEPRLYNHRRLEVGTVRTVFELARP